MEKLVLSLLPAQNENLDVIKKRYNGILSADYYDGIPVFKKNKEVQDVIASLRKAIKRREEDTDKNKFNYKKNDQTRSVGKTSREKKKAGYISSFDRKKQKSERDREIRQMMQSTRGQKS